MFQRLIVLTGMLVIATQAHAINFDNTFYHSRYGLTNPYAKLVDNRGDGKDSLYGVRNFREVLNGVLYRGGANNAFNKHGKRSNKNPLPDEGLANLCKEGFKNSVYLYSTNYKTADPQTNCSSIRGSNQLDYYQMNPIADPKPMLEMVYAAIFNAERGPIYMHCWNGWHASGLISALSLRQFCGTSGQDAVAYWIKNTDGIDDSNYDRIKKQIANFTPYPELNISSTEQAKICPRL